MEKPENINELNALISLIDEPSEEMYTSIREKISSYGKEALPLLEEAWLNSLNNTKVVRIETLIEDIRLNDLYFELNNWAQFYNNDLIKAFILITKFRYPDFDEEKYLDEINKLQQNIWLEINQDLTALEKVKVLNHIFYEVYKFRGQLPQKINLDAYFISDLLDSKKGSAISLGILYISIAQGLDIPIFGLDLHHHFALAYMDDTIPQKPAGEYTSEEVLFYIAVVNKGSVFTKNEIKRYIKQMEIEEQQGYFLPCDNIHIIKRLINELIRVYKNEGKYDKAELLLKLLSALD